jgi:formate/nitrite transporter FocA (FNT family)
MALKIANDKVNIGFTPALIRGILCNWLVCLAVVMAISAKDIIGKIFSCLFPVMTFVACGFEHSIANMYFIPMGLVLKNQAAVVATA